MRKLGLLLILVSAPLLADTFPSQERGFQAEKAFHVGDFDTVNLFNGNLVLTIPIGGTYPVGGGLSYGLTLVYNSNAWDYEQTASELTQALPSRRSNAGMGWRLSLGELVHPGHPTNESKDWQYIGSDGAEHNFYNTLHEGETAVTGVKYTRDNSYLRFRFLNSTQRAVDFPDGTTQIFTAHTGTEWPLTRIEDRFGNFVNIINNYDAVTGELESWKIEDQHGRTQTVSFVTASYYNQVVGSVVLTAFNGTTSTWSFGYSTVTLPAACPDQDNPEPDPEAPQHIVPLLTSVTLPDGSSWSMPTSDYHLNRSAGCRLPGVLKGITTPLLGKVEWIYGGYGFPVAQQEKPWRDFAHGVYTRILKNHNGTTVGTWTYTPALNPPPGGPQAPPGREAIRTVVTPLGDKTESFFSVALDDLPGSWSQFDYGLPFTRFVSDGAGRYLSTRAYDCEGAACTLKRSTYVAYERDQGFLDDFQVNMDRNRRLSATRTTYEDDGARWEAVDHSNFDGLGHYRQAVLSGSFDAGNSATEITNYNPTRGTYPGSFSMLTSGEPWVLGTYSEKTRTEGSSTAKTEHCFDTSTGALLRTRALETGTTRGNNDVVSLFTYTSGNLTREESFGGDVQTVGTGALCTLSLPANQYRIDHGWQYGVRASSQYANAAGAPLSFKSLDTDIDLNTGLVKASRDTSLIRTDFEYDALGRLTWIKPETGHDGWTSYLYSRSLGPGSEAQVQILRKPNGGGANLAESLIKYDSFGRLWQEHTKMADGTWSIRQTLYNPLHWKTSVSEQGNTAKRTQYLSYDPFGRPATIRPPDGAAHDVTLSYAGVRHMSRTSKVGNTYSGGTVNEVLSTTQELYDRQGRLYQVREQAEANGTDTTTTYFYDVGNRLNRVRQATSAGTQNRWFNYDNRGFLTSEQHPEKDGSVSYSNYDARGHARNKTDGPHNLTFAYDRAERLTQVTGNGGQVLKTFSYGTSGTENGRLQSATRYNYAGSPFNATVAVTESYVYGGRQGRPSSRTTQMIFNGNPMESFTQTWTWNALGDPGSVGYPQCAFAGCTPVARTVSPGYSNGFLISVPGWASAISYHPNGMVNQVTHSNNVVDVQANDPNMMRRPASLSSSFGGATLWSTGAYAYDGSGNVVKTGSGYYLYDRVSRLIEGRIYDGATGGGTQKWQSYAYDPFGNIQSISGTSGRSTPTTSATNRLSSGTYDGAGNLTAWNTNLYEYDRFNQMTRMVSGSEDWRYIYTAGDERFWSYRVGGGGSLWALRDLDGKVLREYEAHTSWGTFKDYVYRGSQLLASSHTTDGVRHFHLDHLGTPRLITDAGGVQRAYHVYYPFGEEATAFNQDTEQMKLTGHERDLASLAGTGDDLDYMHARHCSPLTGRFLSVDAGQSAKLLKPQTWNRYSYSRNNPITRLDRDGQVDQNFTPLVFPDDPAAQAEFDNKVASGTVALGAVSLGAIGAIEVGATAKLGEGLFLLGIRAQGIIDALRNFGAGLTGAPTPSQSISGDFERAFSTSKGNVGILADAVTEGSTLVLKNAAVYADKAKTELGVATVLTVAKQLGTELKGKGYTTLIIEGLRYSGAKAGKTQAIVIDLTKLPPM